MCENSLEEMPGRTSAKSHKKSREKLLESYPEKPLREIPEEALDIFWKDLREKSCEKLWQHIRNTFGRNPREVLQQGPREKLLHKSWEELL